MSVKVGMFSKARNVNHIMVGVNGSARRVKKAYIGDETGSAKLCYEDKVSGIISATISMGNKSPTLCGVMGVSGQYYAVGFFKNEYTLSKVSVSNAGEVVDTGQSFSFGSGKMIPCYGDASGEGTIQDAVRNKFSFTDGFYGTTRVIALNIWTMEPHVFSDTSTYTISVSNDLAAPGSSLVGYGVQHTNGGAFMSNQKARTIIYSVRPYKVLTGFVGSYVSKWDDDAIVASYADMFLQMPSRAVMSAYNTSGGSMDIENETQQSISIDDSGQLNMTYISCEDNNFLFEHWPLPNELSVYNGETNSDIYIGAAIQGYYYNESDEIPVHAPYINTLCYTQGNKRYASLIIDFSMEGASTLPQEAATFAFEESIEIPEDSTRGSLYNWHILGVANGKVFILSTMNDYVKIITVTYTKEDGITPISSFDTGYRLSESAVLGEVVPVRYYRPSINYSSGTFVPAFSIIRNNKYCEVVIVPQSTLDK